MPLIETTMAHEDTGARLSPSLSRRHHGKRLRRWLHGKESSHHHENNRSSSSECSSQQENIGSSNKRRSVQDQQAKEDASGDSSFSSTNVEEDEDEDERDGRMLVLNSPTILHSLSDTEVVVGGGSMSPSGRRSGIQRRRSTNSVDSTHSSEKSFYSTKRKGVKYGRDGVVVCCRFCDILRARDEEFLYEDELITVFRPLAPVVDSHILVVPRCHIRNVNMLTKDHMMLLRRMKEVAAMLLQQMPQSTSMNHSSSSIQEPTSPSQQPQHEADYKFAFHTPPFNSIDHVHMHAFRRNEGSFGCFGAIKYRTETWWCRSFEQVISRLAIGSGKRPRRHQYHKHQQNDSNSTETSEEAASSSS